MIGSVEGRTTQMIDDPAAGDRPDDAHPVDDREVPSEHADRTALVTAAASAPMTWRQRLVVPPTVVSGVGAALLWWASLRPTLLPRSAVIQAAISAICLTIGHGAAGVLAALVRHVRARRAAAGTSAPATTPAARRVAPTRPVVVAIAVLVLLLVIVELVHWYRTQQDQRELVGMAPMSWSAVLMLVVFTVVLSAVLLVLARTMRHLVVALERRVERRVPARFVGVTVTAIVVVATLVLVGLGGRQFARWADTNFGAFDDTTADGLEPPQLATLSGGPGSLVDWDELGYEGRNFTGGAPTAAEIEAFDPSRDALDPIRVYVGLQSAGSVDERLDLAIAELERTGAFDREVLVVATPTGTGWVDPDAARSVEFMHAGDTAIVAVQYSYLPSWIAFLVDTNSPRTLGAALIDRMHEHWATLPADDRPTLLAFGESLGSMGAETGFDRDGLDASIASITDRYDGALFTGPTRNNAIFGELVDERDAGSPSWRPVVADEPNVRVVNRISQIDAADPAWASPRVLWVHHPSDAIGTWRMANLWSPPGWGEDPPPYDVPRDAGWLPFVTFVQESFDLMAGFSASPGYGHDYRTDFVHAWTAIAPPDGWTDADADRLQAHLGLDAGPDTAQP
jgi:uncharacterized membrane protein